MDEAYSIVALLEPIKHLFGVIRGAVVDNDKLEVLECLVEHALDGHLQIGPLVVDGHHHAD
jgi:hypothetical protein